MPLLVSSSVHSNAILADLSSLAGIDRGSCGWGHIGRQVGGRKPTPFRDRNRPILLKNSVPEQGRHVTRQPEADLFDPQ